MSQTVRWFSRMTTLVMVFVVLSVGLFSPSSRPAQAQAAPRTAFVHLFEWKWTDIAKECTNWLGPKGFAAVQVSPPQEAIQGAQWWTRYQPVSYSIAKSRSGTQADFQTMVTTCRNAGVDVYVDAVINHMTGGSGTGVNGTAYTKYNYPGTYQSQDFHSCGANINPGDYGSDAWRVRNCELSGLSDLNTGSTYVRGKIASYMIGLANMGVRGFRIDAVKHMDPADMQDILGQVNAAIEPDPYYFQEVIDGGGEAVHASDYYGISGGNADITEFKYGSALGKKFFNTAYAGGNEKISELQTFGPTWGFMPSDKAIVFTDNHDKQRGHGGGGTYITYQSGALYTLANVFMLAWPYGYPQVMSSYAFDISTNAGTDAGPPTDANGYAVNIYPTGSNTPNCFGTAIGQRVCEHRWRPIANMVAFRNSTSAVFSISNWWSNGNNQIAFSRGDKGFVAINRESGALSRTFQTGLAAGVYCDVIHGDYSGGACNGPTVTVNASGQATIVVGAMDAVALHVGAKLASSTVIAGTFSVNATTVSGQNVYVVGNVTALGSWDTSRAMALAPTSYPVWNATLNLPPSTAIEYKYIKKDGNGAVIWESGANRTFTTPASGSLTRSDTWRP